MHTCCGALPNQELCGWQSGRHIKSHRSVRGGELGWDIITAVMTFEWPVSAYRFPRQRGCHLTMNQRASSTISAHHQAAIDRIPTAVKRRGSGCQYFSSGGEVCSSPCGGLYCISAASMSKGRLVDALIGVKWGGVGVGAICHSALSLRFHINLNYIRLNGFPQVRW